MQLPQLIAIILFTLVIHTSTRLIEHDEFLYKLLENRFARRYVLDNFQSLIQRDIEKSAKTQPSFQNDMLKVHNALRKKHCAPPLSLDNKLSESAQAYAEYLANADSKLVHSNEKNFVGENLYSATSSKPMVKPDALKVTRSWYNEIGDYNFEKPDSPSHTGHFTQMVWKDTKKLGVGVAFSNDGQTVYVVAQYTPPGNFLHEFNKNVFPAKC